MQLHTLKPKTKRGKTKYVGRGGKRGTTSGKGTKGQKARSGHKIRPEIRDIIKRIPKLRGYRFRGLQKASFSFNLDQISKHFKNGETVSVKTLRAKNLLPNQTQAKTIVKILGDGKLDKKVAFQGVSFSASAREKARDAGASIK